MKLPPNIPVYGDTTYRGPCPTESAEQVTLMNVLRKTPLGRIAIHVKNEGKRNTRQATWDKAQGMVKGAPDIWIAGSPTCLVELKRKDHTQSSISDDQVKFLKAAQDNGAWVCIALGWEAAYEAVKTWSKKTS